MTYPMSINDLAALARIPVDCDCERDDDGQWTRCPACVEGDRAAEEYDDDGRDDPAAGAEYAGAAYYAGPVDDEDTIPFP